MYLPQRKDADTVLTRASAYCHVSCSLVLTPGLYLYSYIPLFLYSLCHIEQLQAKTRIGLHDSKLD